MLKQYKVNSQIIVPEVRLLAEDGKQIGVIKRDEALDYALGQGADLVLIGEAAKPPVAKIINFKKFLYQEQKKVAEAKRGQKGGTKEIRVGSSLAAPADVQARIKKTGKLLTSGFNVKVVVKLPGRQMSHPEFGHKIIASFVKELAGVGKLSRPGRIEGKSLVAFFESDHAKT